ncbi:DUF883 family protein [Rahnella aquatilis]|uniref:DUF883 domain-containing protein n=1 Tax=Rahnella aquatilis (strain ATCC 33071 / DSM 4594 / JCM 1683 / NBRC 105701 / NCIMB 13365 / CIP 78.65) TaxID=745277 RepID=H2IW51_RAHAC|nr:DUF883 family protein [Rahnella aquatilis]AEX50720.1 hypothetical protein Rahaq2_0809 [Rahnella aquatilis CIP 78.65 = ATCC 33071]KFD01779.1 membrane protein [Rahnella aquatilis CIP 78.65 = ATCC 33071]
MFNRKDKIEKNVDQDVTLLADTLDEVLQSAGDKSRDELDKIRSKAQGVLRETRARFNSEKLSQQAREAAATANDYVKDNPWYGVGAGAAIGIVIGVLLGRR